MRRTRRRRIKSPVRDRVRDANAVARSTVSLRVRDRRHYLDWVFEAKKRFGLCVLDYVVTSDRIHLWVKDIGGCHSTTHGSQIRLRYWRVIIK
jgi:hypothetical protein